MMPEEEEPMRQSAEIVRQFSETKERVSDAQHQSKLGKSVKKETVDNLKKELEMDDHIIPLEECVQRLETSLENGLSSAEAAHRLERDGPNALTPAKVRPGWMVFMHHLFSGFAGLLWLAALLALFGAALQPQNRENLYLGIVLIIVVCVTAVFSYSQDAKAAAVMDGFKKLVPQIAQVKRDGQVREINARDLVVGDIVTVNGGDKTPADLRIFSCKGMKVDNSSLTGEAEPQTRAGEPTDENPLETKNLAFYSTSITEGSGTGIVISCGDHTVIGRIADLASNAGGQKTPIRKEIEHFIHIISTIAIILGIIFFIFGTFVYDPITNAVFVLGIIVANVPEGLLATVTVSLTLTAQRMKRKKVLVKNLESVETLGSTMTICSDKTGTLTQNRMTMVHIFHNGGIFTVDTSSTTANFDSNSREFQDQFRCMALCNNAKFLDDRDDLPIQQRRVCSDATEQAIFKFGHPIKDNLAWREECPLIHSIPFKSANKYQIHIHSVPGEKRLLCLIKGAPERVRARCTTIMSGGQPIPLDEKQMQICEEANDSLCSMGERVLGFAQAWLDADKYQKGYEFSGEEPYNFPTEEFCFLGMCGIIDPPRSAVPGAVKTCQTAGIKVIMVTGDHPGTAEAIARQVNIITGDTRKDVAKREGISGSEVNPESVSAIVVTGSELKDMSDEDLDKVLDYNEIVFARTSPQQKLRIVEGCQKKGQIVAVTGDGVNDSPALKKADIGIAMGITGSEVSKEAADMILLDDNFASIVRGVEEGRLIFDNLKKSIAYTLSSNIPELLPFMLFILLQIPLPLTTILILCVDIGTDLIPAISLAYEVAENDIMLRRPRDPKVDRLVTAKLMSFSYLQIGIMQACAGMYTYLVVLGDFGFPASSLRNSAPLFDVTKASDPVGDVTYEMRLNALANAQTAYFVSIVIVQWADLLACKTRMLSLFQQGMSNMVMNFGIFSETFLALFVCYVPFIDIILGTRPIHPRHWFPALPYALFILCYDELRKLIIRNNRSGWLEQNTYY